MKYSLKTQSVYKKKNRYGTIKLKKKKKIVKKMPKLLKKTKAFQSRILRNLEDYLTQIVRGGWD